MSILDSIKDLANKAVNTVKEAADDVQDKAAELKADYDEAGGAKGLLDKAGDKLSDLGEDISAAASKATRSVKETADDAIDAVQDKAADLKDSFQDKSADAKEAASDAAETVKEKAAEIKADVKEAAHDAADAIKGNDAPKV